MVAISLYKGNLHKVPDVPRKWLMPAPQISVRDFKTLLQRRSRALSRLPCTATTSFSGVDGNTYPSNIGDNENNCEIDTVKIMEEDEEKRNTEGGKEGDVVEEVGDGIRSSGDCLEMEGDISDSAAVEVKPEVGGDNVAMEIEFKVIEEHEVKKEEEKAEVRMEEVPVNPKNETINNEDTESDKDKRKRVVEEKLKILEKKKHSLVRLLKQIQNAEEELKRQSRTQGVAVRHSVPLQVDIPIDIGSMTRLNTPRMGSDRILTGEMEGVEHDGISNHNIDTSHSLRMSSTSPSPSSDS